MFKAKNFPNKALTNFTLNLSFQGRNVSLEKIGKLYIIHRSYESCGYVPSIHERSPIKAWFYYFKCLFYKF